MNLLPKKIDIDRQKNIELKKEIDSGVALATKIDKLRETALNEERQLKVWRENSIKVVQKEIDDYLTVKENLRIETEKAELHRQELLIPLDKEWKELNTAKVKVNKELNDIFIEREQLKEEQRVYEQQCENLSKLVSKAKKNEQDTEKEKQKAISLRELAQSEYEIARLERETHKEEQEKYMSEMRNVQDSYESSIKMYDIRMKEIKEKEADLIIREKHLESQQQQLRKAKEALKI